MNAAATVIAAGGLLGSAVAADATARFASVVPVSGLRWDRPQRAAEVIEKANRHALAASPDGKLVVYWCAGSGRVGTPRATFDTEQELLRRVLRDLKRLAGAADTLVFCFASSGGGVWSGSPNVVFDERVPVDPWHDYGRAKQVHEQMVEDAVAHSAMSGLIVRISNLFGRQQWGKPLTGLVNNLTMNAIRRIPTGIYVPLDTQRDYISSRRAAVLMSESVWPLVADSIPGACKIQVVASGRSHTIGFLAVVLGRVLGRPVPLTVGYSQSSSQQPRTLAFRSVNIDLQADAPHLAHDLDRLVARLLQRRP